MSVMLSTFLGKVNNLLGDNISGTTTSNGNTDKTTFIDSSMSKYEDGYFGDPERRSEWWAYIGTALRPIKNFTSSSGTFEVYTAFSSQVSSSTAYELHRFDRDEKINAINMSLRECYPDFYQRVEDATTLDGTGSDDNEYEVPATFAEFPDQIWQKDTDGDQITYTEITDYIVKELGGTYYFYADIVEDDDIVLIGKTYLSQFTTDSSTTELTDAQADVVALLATSIFYRTLSGKVNASDIGRFDALAARFLMLYEQRKNVTRMRYVLPRRVDWGWLDD